MKPATVEAAGQASRAVPREGDAADLLGVAGEDSRAVWRYRRSPDLTVPAVHVGLPCGAEQRHLWIGFWISEKETTAPSTEAVGDRDF